RRVTRGSRALARQKQRQSAGARGGNALQTGLVDRLDGCDDQRMRAVHDLQRTATAQLADRAVVGEGGGVAVNRRLVGHLGFSRYCGTIRIAVSAKALPRAGRYPQSERRESPSMPSSETEVTGVKAPA